MYTTLTSLTRSLIVLLIGIILITVLIILWKRQAKKEKFGYCYSFFDWIIDKESIKIILTIILSIMLILIGTVTVTNNMTIIHDNRVEESSKYQRTIATKESLENALNVTEDIVNTDLYSQAISYNIKLADIKTKYNNSNYKLNFSGNYDWNALEPIVLE